MVQGHQDNYEKVREDWRKKAVNWDYEEHYRALGLPGYQKGVLPIYYYGMKYELDPGTGEIWEAEHPKRELTFAEAMAIYHVFYYSKPHPVPSGIWVPLREVKGAGPFAPAFIRQNLEPFARAFSGKTDILREAGKKLGFLPVDQSDAGLEARVFSNLSIRFLFWDGDEEFPAQANVLFDSNITDYVHEETAIMIGGDGLRRLTAAAFS